jgi:hydrogenase maturation protein HypF
LTAAAVQRVRVRARGTVQGVGFRPFVHRRARELGLAGWVGNDGEGVLLEAEGLADAIAALVRDVRVGPSLAVVEAVEVEVIEPVGRSGFTIATTRHGGGADVRVSTDVGPCEACLAELADPADRRFRYPFLNCTDCGPRYTIVRAVPYDREATTMRPFVMCARCQAEYQDPADRRFHAQPNACPTCGPRLTWGSGAHTAGGPPALEAAASCLRSGGIVAVKGVGGYHLACDAGSESAVTRLRRRKRRDDKPFAVMVADLSAAQQLCELGATALAALASSRRPIVLAPRRADAPVTAGVAPRVAELGVMLPSSPLHVLLLGAVGRPLVMTSGNSSSEPMAHEDAEARERLGPLVDGMLSHDRQISVRTDDSVLQVCSEGRVRMIRRARGWVPQPLQLPLPAAHPVLAVGAQLKSTVALARGASVVVSQHLGDLDDWATYQAFTAAVEHLTRLSGVTPAVVAHDLHPDYRSTAWARSSGLTLDAVQHHHAHVAACLVEHGLTSRVLGVAFDGVGLGSDGTLWGGEFLLADLAASERMGQLAPVALPGGDAAVREPWRVALAWLHRALGPDVAATHGPRLDGRWAAVLSIVASGRAPETSSAGRLFDAVAALLGVRTRVTYEGQAAVELEALARRADLRTAPSYSFSVDGARLDPAPMLRQLLADRDRGMPVERLAAGFHLGLADSSAQLAARLASECGVDTVALTGGVFQNTLLSDALATALRRAGLRVLVHEQLPPNDGAISIGQAAVAAARLAAPQRQENECSADPAPGVSPAALE